MENDSLPVSVQLRLEEVCARFEAAWKAAGSAAPAPRIEEYLGAAAGPERAALLRELLRLDLHYRTRAGDTPTPEEYRRRLPGHQSAVAALFATVVLPAATGPASGEPGPAEVPDMPRQAGRYRIEAEVARGGMGCVLRAHDPDLERPLAVKVLLGKHRGNAHLERRFLEEARLTGQLQHPAIPPVHEVGRLDDGRPFFAMKLIKGHTLHDLLEQRRGPGEELPRWLGVFTAVCQGVAYAHSKGVIHRDLKPANVMVGAFGEVQVMDWGFAKVLDAGRRQEETAEASVVTTGRGGDPSTWSRAGDVLGTLAYMAPEQARGEIDSLDARSDVFGLGAILCVILTGEPPYRGSDGRQLQRQAERAELSEAFARLDGCGADREVVALARCCLAPAREDRPADAGEVARALVAYQAGVEERLRRAELERAAAQVKAAEERKRRRLQVGLGAVVTVALVLGTAAAVYWQQQRQRAGEQAEAGLAQAAELRRDYRFKDAEAMLKQASGWVRQAADRQLQQRVVQAEGDLALARDLDAVRQQAATLVEGKFGNKQMRSEYPRVLAEHGLDVLEGDLDELAQTIQASAVREDIIAALDGWARAETNRASRQRLLELTSLADDPGPWRQGVRHALAQGDGRRLRQFVVGTEKGKPTPAVVLLLADAFRVKREEPTGLMPVPSGRADRPGAASPRTPEKS
jgi:serine/threonine-protein kinase